MWEVGYAMALGIPVAFVIQNIQELPFDLKDMQTLEYNRNQLTQTLATPLRRMIIDTASHSTNTAQRTSSPQDEVIADLRNELSELKSIIGQAVQHWNPSKPETRSIATSDLSALEGTWLNTETGSYLYATVVNGDLIAPYCYGGNSSLTGVYFGWKRIGEYWFGRFAWMNREFAGFCFLKQQSLDVLSGAWWLDDGQGERAPTAPPDGAGVPTSMTRMQGKPVPGWAQHFFDEVREEGLTSRLTRC